jgi:hypothetical protein
MKDCLLILAAAIFFVLPNQANSAEIDVIIPEKDSNWPLIIIEGQIELGDDARFRKIASEHPNAIVLLNSDGGMIRPAMDIGRTIKLLGYGTAIYKSRTCASACALIWVAGSTRAIFEGGRVGFHASYLDTDGAKLETGVGNALVGHYLTQLGFGEKTVVFATLASPDQILWLNDDTASMSGISFDTVPNDEKQRASGGNGPQLAPPPITSAPARPATPTSKPGKAKVRDGGSQKFRNPEDFAQALRGMGYQAGVSYEIKDVPMLSVNVSGEEVAIGFSGCSAGGCDYIEFIDYYFDITEDEAYYIARYRLLEEGFSHPFWDGANKTFALYSYFVIGSEGLSVKTLIENLNYFVRDNMRLEDLIVQRRAKGQSASFQTDRAPEAKFGAQEAADLRSAITRALRPHWSGPSGADAEKLVSIVNWELNADGSLRGRPRCRTLPSSITESNQPHASSHCERAIRAVQLAAPFTLPEQFYDRWKALEWQFDRRL